MNTSRRVYQWGSRVLGVVVVVLVALFVFTPTTQAILRPLNTSVFSGRFIPAFIGAAYDPSSAYEEMAGLPVYVVAFDNWQGPLQTGEQSWIVSDLAVKTQIRADGSFQVQGLPEASYYGVYFPFALQGGEVARTDCLNVRDNFTGTATDANPCKTEFAEKQWPFRMPRPADQLIDVFSYAANYLTDEASGALLPTVTGLLPVLDSQVSTQPLSTAPCLTGTTCFEQVRFEHAFVTNRKDLDIENNINTFPVVPNTTLRVNFRPDIAASAGTQFEVWAMRVADKSETTGELKSLNFPVIRGRAILSGGTITGPVTQSLYSFQAFAPAGQYSVIIWRHDNLSPTYKDWDGNSSLSSQLSGWMLVDVDNYVNADWRDALTWVGDEELLVMRQNVLTVWGTVTDSAGFLMSSDNVAPGFSWPDGQVKVVSAQKFPYSGTAASNLRVVRADAVDDVTESPATVARGVYGITFNTTEYATRLGGATGSALSRIPRSDEITVYLDNESGLNGWSKSPVGTGFLSSTRGPLRRDISTTFSQGGEDDGFDTGLFVKATAPGGTLASGAKLTFKVIEPPVDVSVHGETRTFYLNRLGEIHVPLSELTPIQAGYTADELSFIARVELPQAVSFQVFSLSNGFASLSANLTPLASRPHTDFNLAILNKIGDAIAGPPAYADEPLFPVQVSISEPQLEADTTAGEVNIVIKYGNGFVCEDCEVRDKDGNEVNAVPLNARNVEVRLLQPNDSRDLATRCYQTPGLLSGVVPGSGIIGGIKNIGCAFATTASASQPYIIDAQVHVGGDQILYAKSKLDLVMTGGATELRGRAVLDFGADCRTLEGETVAASAAGLKKWLPTAGNVAAHATGWVVRGGCEAGKFLTENVEGVLGMVYDYGLQTRALTQDEPIIQMFDIVRNVVNVLFVVIFVTIGIMTILRYQPEQWHFSVILPRLLVALIMANFSLLIVQALLDINNFASYTIFQLTNEIIQTRMTASGSAIAGATTIGALGTGMAAVGVGLVTSIATIVAATGGIGAIPLVLLVVGVVIGILGKVLVLLIIFLMRYLIIWLAVIAAPMVFMLGVLPPFSNYAKKWWTVVTMVTFIQTGVAAILSVGVLLLMLGGTFPLFEQFGPALVGIIALYAASKYAQDGLGSVAAAAGAGAIAGAATGFVAGIGARAGAGLKGAAMTEQKSGLEFDEQTRHLEGQLKGQGADEDEISAMKSRRGLQRWVPFGRKASEKDAKQQATHGVGGTMEKAAEAGEKQGFKKLVDEQLTDEQGKSNTKVSDYDELNYLYNNDEQIGLDQHVYNMSNEDTGKGLRSLTRDEKTGKRLLKHEFYQRFNALDSTSGEQRRLILQAKNHKEGKGFEPKKDDGEQVIKQPTASQPGTPTGDQAGGTGSQPSGGQTTQQSTPQTSPSTFGRDKGPAPESADAEFKRLNEERQRKKGR